MTKYSCHFRRYLKLFSCLMLFAGLFLMFPLKTMAQKGSTGLLSLVSRRASAIQVSFTYSPTYPQVGQAVQFTNTSKDRMTSWAWDFGDGATSVSQNPSHSYSAPGYYSVALTAGNSSGSRTARRSISVTISNAAAFTYSPASPRPGQLIRFVDATTGSPTSWQWHFGDGTISTDKNPIHAYGVAALYKVTLVAGTSSGSKDVSRTISVMASAAITTLSASFIFSPTSPTAGQAVQFTDTSTGSPTSWLWNFGDGTTSTIQNPSHSFTTAASYTVTLTATGSSGSQNSSQTIAVFPALSASFTYSPLSPVAGQAVQFTDTSTGSPTSWQWNFGDGTTSTAKNPSHTYATVASYNVTLTVSNNTGSKSASLAVNILPSATLIASFTYSPTAPFAGQPVQFTDTSTGSPTSWQWNFGDGASSTAQNPSHTYTAAGSYSGTLTVHAGANQNNTSKTITVGYANVITAASPSFADVSAAVSAAGSGDTVIVPEGAATWNSNLIITKGINLIGAGIGNTVITSNYTNSDDSFSNSAYLIVYNPSSPELNEPFRLSGFTVDCANKCRPLLLKNNNVKFINKIRIDHNRIMGGYGSYVIQVKGHVWGVADNNVLDGCYISVDFMDQDTWNNYSFNFGTANAFYFEDNTMVCRGTAGVIRSEMGAMWVCRYNVWDGSLMTQGHYPWQDAHGNGTGHWSVMGVESYGNVLTNPNSAEGCNAFTQRGGKALFYDNKTNLTSVQRVWEEFNDNVYGPPITNPAGQPQHVSDSYYWGNRGVGNTRIVATVEFTVNYGGDEGIVPQENREFWQENPSFDGTTGVGIGPLSSRPVTCTKGVAYWASDTKTLYKATATNVWTEYYKPYTYPHPLRNQ